MESKYGPLFVCDKYVITFGMIKKPLDSATFLMQTLWTDILYKLQKLNKGYE